MEYELRFDPKTIEHLGVKMYSTLPPALAELISNSYDADASKVTIQFHEQNKIPKSIIIIDDGHGMSADDIQNKFLVIGRNRRKEEGDSPTRKYGRLATGKKGLGKLALFGLAKEIIVDTVKNGLRNRFTLDWDHLLSADGVYNPVIDKSNEKTDKCDGTIIKLAELKRKTPFDLEGLADSLSKIFIVGPDFNIELKSTDGKLTHIDNDRKYQKIESEFYWAKDDLIKESHKFYSKIELKLITAKSPIPPVANLRGVTIFSRGKLVNAPEYFASSTSSYFFEYLTGWIKADFIDLIDEDVISTNRQSINWENSEMDEFRSFLSELITMVGREWRKRRSDKKNKDLKDKTGIDTEKWISTLPEEIKNPVKTIVNKLSGDEGVTDSYSPIVKAVHALAPEYPYFHWRNLHDEIKDASKIGYEGKNYYSAFLEAAKRYANRVREYSGNRNEHDINLMAQVFGIEEDRWKVAIGYLRSNKTEFAQNTLSNIESAQRKLSQGIFEGGRNVVAHEEALDLEASGLFSEKDCLDLLSLISHLMCRVDTAYQRKCVDSKKVEK